jgi:hypothetical protein
LEAVTTDPATAFQMLRDGESDTVIAASLADLPGLEIVDRPRIQPSRLADRRPQRIIRT